MTRAGGRAAGVLAVLCVSGCAMQQQAVESQLANPSPINCRTARGDIRVLRQEKANVVQQVAEGVTAIYPAGLVVGLLTGTESTKVQVAIGDYNQQIDARIAQIQQQCGVND